MKENQPAKHEIKEARKKAGWTQKQMAHELGVSVRAVEDWEQGINPMHPLFYKELLKNANK